ncbi:MAG: hypothetical protein J5747_00310 [Spirochaetaceae bacterium]|nr:hypothetical protein [Spirochaetaceae bacterium]
MNKPNAEEFFSKMEEIISLKSEKKEYDINIIDELHADENAHTRILMKLLQFSRRGKYFILDKFIELLNEKLDESFKIKAFSEPNFKNQWAQIDGYIYSVQDNTAIIIENKIQWAIDQNKQIERYIKSSNEYGKISKERIYVIYLTDNGVKKASDISLTSKAKEMLCISENSSGRYIELNYQEHLLPLFKEILSYLDFTKEIYLKSAIIQYVDYLDGRFGLRKREKKFFESINQDLLNMFKINPANLVSLKDKADRYFEIINYENALKEQYPKEYLKYSCFFSNLKEYIFPDQLHPGKVKNDFFHFFARSEEHKKELLPFTVIDIKWNSYPNIIILYMNSGKWLKIDFPNDDLERSQNINLYIPEDMVICDDWIKKDMKTYVKTISYENSYESIKNSPVEFIKSIYSQIRL